MDPLKRMSNFSETFHQKSFSTSAEAFGKSFTKETLPGKVSSKFVIPLTRASLRAFALLTALITVNFLILKTFEFGFTFLALLWSAS